MNNVQAELHKNAHTRNIILKARQQGLTTYECIDGLDDALFHRNFTMVIIAHEKEAVKKIFKKIKFAWDEFPKDLKAYLGFTESTDSINEIAFNNGSSIRVALSSRADTVTRLHISEFGKICAKYPQKAQEIITGAIPSVPENGRIDIESTAEGEFGEFHDMFWQAWNNPPITHKQFKAFFFPWTCNPEYQLDHAGEIPQFLREYQAKYNLSDKQINWYFIELGLLKEKIKQEYPTIPEEAFAVSGFKLFSAESLNLQTPLDGTKIGDWIIFKDYLPSHRYAVGADVAEGVGQDSSTGQVIDLTTNEQVACYKSNSIAPDMFAHELRWAANRYGGALIAPERNNHGHTTIATLKTFPEVAIYQEEILDQAINRKTVKLGWLTTGASKPLMLYELHEAINSNAIKIYDKTTLSELRTYDKQDLSVTRFDPDQTKHWDMVIALAIAYAMRKVFIPVPDTTEEEAISRLLDSVGGKDPYHREIGIPKHEYEEKRAVHELLADFEDKE